MFSVRESKLRHAAKQSIAQPQRQPCRLGDRLLCRVIISCLCTIAVRALDTDDKDIHCGSAAEHYQKIVLNRKYC